MRGGPGPGGALALVEAVSAEVIRKLRLASEVESKDDREIVLEEVFCDVTGLLDDTAQEQLGLQGKIPFYLLLACHYASPKGTDAAVAVLHMLKGLYGQGYGAPLVALLLHRWLLIRRGGVGRGLPEEQRARLANVINLGCAQLFSGDVHGGARAFMPLWHCLCYQVILGEEESETGPARSVSNGGGASHLLHTLAQLPGITLYHTETDGKPAAADRPSDQQLPPSSCLATLPAAARTGLLAAVGAFLVYYMPVGDIEYLFKWFPPPHAPPAPTLPSGRTNQTQSHATPPQSSKRRTTADTGVAEEADKTTAGRPARRPPLAALPWSGVDFIMLEIVDVLSRIRSEAGLIQYLEAAQQLRGFPLLHQQPFVKLSTRLRLQGILYALSSPGGPHYPPRRVRAAALHALDALFPTGRSTRHVVRTLFRLLHPVDLASDLAAYPLVLLRSLISQLTLLAFYTLHSLVVWRHWGSGWAPEPPARDTTSSEQGAVGDEVVEGYGQEEAGRGAGGWVEGGSGVMGLGAVTRPGASRDQLEDLNVGAGAVSGGTTPTFRRTRELQAAAHPVFTGAGSLSRSSQEAVSGPVEGLGGLAGAELQGPEAHLDVWVVPEPVQAEAVQFLVLKGRKQSAGVDLGGEGGLQGGDEWEEDVGVPAEGVFASKVAAGGAGATCGPSSSWQAVNEAGQQLLAGALNAVESTVQAAGALATRLVTAGSPRASGSPKATTLPNSVHSPHTES